MNFSQQVKTEITKRDWAGPCCVTSACYGVACFARLFGPKGLEFNTEKAYIAQWAKGMYSEAGIQGKVFVRGVRQKSYVFAVQDPFEIEKLLAMFGHSGDETNLRLRRDNFLCEECLAAFTASAFLCAGTIVSPEKGYNLEFVSPRHNMMQDFSEVLKEKSFQPKLTTRKGLNILYFRASEQIEDLLTFMGAAKSTLDLMNLKVYKDLRNTANRITNCETANIDKTIAASQKTIEAIRYLKQEDLLDTMDDILQEAARVRIENPDLSLNELSELLEQPVSKSSLSQRFKKIRDKAKTHKQTKESAAP